LRPLAPPASVDRLMTTGQAATTLLFVSVQLIEVMLLGTSDDTELLNRLAEDLLRFDIRASPNPLSEERPVQIGSSVTSTAVLLWTRSAVESRWLVREVDGARRSGPVIVGRADDVEPPSYARKSARRRAHAMARGRQRAGPRAARGPDPRDRVAHPRSRDVRGIGRCSDGPGVASSGG
jgi:hypothetical protein